MLPQLNLISFFSFFHYQPFGEGDPVIVDETGVDIIQALDIFSPTQPSSPASHRTIPPGSRSFQGAVFWSRSRIISQDPDFYFMIWTILLYRVISMGIFRRRIH